MSNFYKNTELAARYNISEATVRNWIKSSLEGKLNLELVGSGRRMYVAKSIRNIPVIEGQVENNRKYRNTLSSKTVSPSASFYEVFSESQTHDIIRGLELHREIPLQYGYFAKGAQEWNEYINKQASVEAPSMLRGSIELLADNYSYLERRLAKFTKVNVVDIGVGNALPVRGVLDYLLSRDKLGRYVALDFSVDMLDVAKQNLKEWFGARVCFEGYQIDVGYERFANILSSKDEQAADTVNLVMLLGATPNNLRIPRDAFRTICESMNGKDMFVYTDSVRPLASLPEWLEYNYDIRPREPELLDRHRRVLDQLNVKDSFYTVEMGLNREAKYLYSRIKFKFALTIDFNLRSGRQSVSFEKGDTILLWRCWRKTPGELVEQLESCGFYVLHTSQSEDHNYILTIAEVKRS